MARIAGSNGARTAEAVRSAALTLLYDHGYEGFGLRQLAQSVGLQPASLYHHFDSKQDLLFSLVADHMRSLLDRTAMVLAGCGEGALERLAAFIQNHLEYHIDKKREVYIANFELRALSEANRAAILGLRNRYEAMLICVLDQGRADGVIGTADTHVAAYAVLAMLTGACTWYRPDGRLSRAEMITLHTRLVLEGCAVGGVASLTRRRGGVRPARAADGRRRAPIKKGIGP